MIFRAINSDSLLTFINLKISILNNSIIVHNTNIAKLANITQIIIAIGDLVANETICAKEEKFYDTPYFKELIAFLNTYKDWLKELSDNKRSLNLFNLECGDKPFELVTDRKPQQGGFLGFGKKNYEAFYDALNKAAQKVRGDKASSLFIETYSRATKKIAEDKLKM